VGCVEKYKLTPQKIGKIIILVGMLLIIAWLLFVGFDELIFSAKRFSKRGDDSKL
jgi:hypothetical protein